MDDVSLGAAMSTFTPPDVPEGVDPVGHIFATMTAIRQWYQEEQRFIEVVVGDELRRDMLMHARMRSSIELKGPNRLFGVPLRFTENWTRGRSYTITHQNLSDPIGKMGA